MKKNNATLEIIAPTVEEAIEKGLNDLGLTRDDIDIEILDEGSKGLFGLRARQARVRLIIKDAQPSQDTEKMGELEQQITDETTTPMETSSSVPDSNTDLYDEVLTIAKDTVEELLQKMKVHATVSAEFANKDEKTGIQPVMINISGQDLSILIGKNAETLNALQYITRLIVSKELGKAIHLIIDVEGYRLRREQQLQKIAERMAAQVVETGRSLALEPMPANERRIVHLALRDNPNVYTESTGEGHHRKVVIYPKQ